MPRARIPYSEIDDYISNKYPSPAFVDARRTQFQAGAPTTVYDRRTGNFQRIGYLVDVIYELLTGVDSNLNPVYEIVREQIFVPTE